MDASNQWKEELQFSVLHTTLSLRTKCCKWNSSSYFQMPLTKKLYIDPEFVFLHPDRLSS